MVLRRQVEPMNRVSALKAREAGDPLAAGTGGMGRIAALSAA
jgi:hypothetical protein